jgi:hypothetical protein
MAISAAGKSKPWAVLAYVVADDKGSATLIDAAAKDELEAICDAADFGMVDIATQVDFKRTTGIFRATVSEGRPRPRGFKDVAAEKFPIWRKIHEAMTHQSLRVEMKKEDLNAARGSVLQQFLEYGREACSAERYVVFFYGHAYGPMGLFFDHDTKTRVPNTLRLNDLADSLAESGKRASIVMFRDCLMNTLETAYQLRKVAEYLIASQSILPIAGVWPWPYFMDALMPSATSADQAGAFIKGLGRFMTDPANRKPFADTPISLLDLDAADEVVPPLKALVRALEAAREDPDRCRACAAVLEAARSGYPDDHSNPGDPALLDVPTVCDGLAKLSPDPVARPAAALGTVIRERLVKVHYTQGERYHGTSIYYKPLPRDVERSHIQQEEGEDAEADARYYRQLALSEATGWHRIALNPLEPT